MKEILFDLWQSTGMAAITWQQLVMIGLSCFLLYLALEKKFEPLLLIPIAFGMLLTNLPMAGLMDAGTTLLKALTEDTAKQAVDFLANPAVDVLVKGVPAQIYTQTPGGVLHYFSIGNKLSIFPSLIFLGIGAMTDFSPLIANPKSIFLGGGAQLGIFITFMGAALLGFTGAEAAAIGNIGGANGPATILLATLLAPHLLGPIAVAAYSYMALVPIIQPPIMKLLTTPEERSIKMEQMREVTRTEKVIFPVLVTIAVAFFIPSTVGLVGMLMFGNLIRESLVTERLSKTAQNELINIVTIFLGLAVGGTAKAEYFIRLDTLQIILLGVIAFGMGTAGGVLVAKLMNKLLGGNAINPLIGSAGVAAVPMAARVSQVIGQKENPGNFLLMHAMGANVAGVIGSAVAAGVLLTFFY